MRRHLSSEDGVVSRVEQDTIQGAGLWVGECWQATKGPLALTFSAAPVGSALGETTREPLLQMPAPPAERHAVSVYAVDGKVECVRFDAEAFHHSVQSLGPKCVEAAERMQIHALRSERGHGNAWQVRTARRQRRRLKELERSHLKQQAEATYKAMVALAVADGVVSAEERKTCKAFKERHGISDEQHQIALREAGWEGRPFD